jgi:hypothetical protein
VQKVAESLFAKYIRIALATFCKLDDSFGYDVAGINTAAVSLNRRARELLPPLALAPTAESSPAPEIFFSKTSSVRKATPFLGAETIFGQVFGRGGMSEIFKTKIPPTRGSSAS